VAWRETMLREFTRISYDQFLGSFGKRNDLILREWLGDGLDPARIVIVGGTGVVSAAVESALAAFVPDPGLVRRIAGADRYATAAAIAADAFAPGVSVFVFTFG